jgi:hypothetical protein
MHYQKKKRKERGTLIIGGLDERVLLIGVISQLYKRMQQQQYVKDE